MEKTQFPSRIILVNLKVIFSASLPNFSGSFGNSRFKGGATVGAAVGKGVNSWLIRSGWVVDGIKGALMAKLKLGKMIASISIPCEQSFVILFPCITADFPLHIFAKTEYNVIPDLCKT